MVMNLWYSLLFVSHTFLETANILAKKTSDYLPQQHNFHYVVFLPTCFDNVIKVNGPRK